MNTLEQHNKEVENFVKEELTYGGYGYHLDDTMPIDFAVKLIQSQNKQLYIKIAEGEIERLLELDSNPYPFSVNPDKPMSHIYKNIGFTKSLESQLTRWQNILTELRK